MEMANERVIEKQRFYISEFEEEAAWLSFMHREGFRVTAISGMKYEFEKCDKEDYVYQLDFKQKAEDEEEYIRMFEDYGWEYVMEYRCWFYFRKRREENEDMSIFSDNESKIDMCRRVIHGQFLSILPLYLIILGYEYLMFFTDIFRGNSFWSGLLLGIAVGLMICVIFGLGLYIGQLGRLNQKIKKLQQS